MQQLDWEAIFNVILYFVPDHKIARSVLNKFKSRAGEEIDPEFNPVGEFHWDLAKIKLENNDYIGWYDGVRRYYPKVVRLNLEDLEISIDPKWEKVLRSQLVAARKILDSLKGGTDA